MKTLSQIIDRSDNLEIINYLQEKKLLHKSRECDKCHNLLHIEPRKDIPDKYRWRCSKCSKSVSIRVGTFFEGFRHSLVIMLKLILHWALQTRQTDHAELLDISRESIIQFQQKIRLTISKALNKSVIQLGIKIVI